MTRSGLALVIALSAAAVLAGCARKLPPGVLEGGDNMPPPPSEQHRVPSRVNSQAAAPAPAAPGLRAPATR
ncbi:hypothetical protein FHS82_003409 [Pseudochelatococcus lubricantis]|uniref:Lipoprotein n=1 Tax=Pseudochelatococcus lubricantis TaxID=1538102 RepID=A0ABX0V338_9HYPH|nr:hypothetical protein [Pseudochelatococcus lubricantis]NIJ59551.1 hypothetical protein [Pseudochelatococcus lubricantis]